MLYAVNSLALGLGALVTGCQPKGLEKLGDLVELIYRPRGQEYTHVFRRPCPILAHTDNKLVVLRDRSKYRVSGTTGILGG